jgi:hypothetical protein
MNLVFDEEAISFQLMNICGTNFFVEITDLSGKKVYAREYSGSDNQAWVSVPVIPASGMYFLTVHDLKQRAVIKLIR